MKHVLSAILMALLLLTVSVEALESRTLTVEKIVTKDGITYNSTENLTITVASPPPKDRLNLYASRLGEITPYVGPYPLGAGYSVHANYQLMEDGCVDRVEVWAPSWNNTSKQYDRVKVIDTLDFAPNGWCKRSILGASWDHDLGWV